MRSPMRTRTLRNVMPWAFQCVSAQAKVSGNCSRYTVASEAENTFCLKMGTQRRRSGWPGKKLSLPSSTSSNSTTTQSGDFNAESAEFGSPPSGQTKPTTRPRAPFMRPASTQRFCVSSTRHPSHSSRTAGIPLKSSSSHFASFCWTSAGPSWKALIAAMGFRCFAACSRSRRAFTCMAPSWPRRFLRLPSMRSGASVNASSSLRPAAVRLRLLRLRLASQAWSACVHSQSARARVTRRNSSASSR